MAPTDLQRLEHERAQADHSYNEALTALDRAVANAATGGAAGGVTGPLIAFLQRITAFVETKDRQFAAEQARRIESLSSALDAVAEVRIQVGVLQRAVEMLKRPPGGQQQAGSAQSSAASPQPPAPSTDDYKYVGFEDAFRGSDAVVAERVGAYVPLFAGRANVLDIGCGRGELLAALRTAGIDARGIDTNAEMAGAARARGLDARQADALGYLTALPEASLGGLIATQVIEHLEPSYLMRVLDAAARVLQPGAPIVLETINPACWLAFFSSYIRDFTHVRPVHPETLQYLLRASGFSRVTIQYSAPVPDHMKMTTIDLPAEVLASADATARAVAAVAHAVNANAVILNHLMFTHMDYAAVGYRS